MGVVLWSLVNSAVGTQLKTRTHPLQKSINSQWLRGEGWVLMSSFPSLPLLLLGPNVGKYSYGELMIAVVVLSEGGVS